VIFLVTNEKFEFVPKSVYEDAEKYAKVFFKICIPFCGYFNKRLNLFYFEGIDGKRR